MSEITLGMTLREARKIPEFASFSRFIMFNNQAPGEDPIHPTLDPEDFTLKSATVVEGFNRLRELVRDGVQVAHDIYTAEEKAKEPDKDNTKLIYMPCEPGKPFVLVCAGGAYATVCSFGEGFPTATRLNAMGYNAFVLSYRVHECPLIPKPTEDVAAALRYIFSHADEFKVDPENYAVCGFSAGGHLTGSWGTRALGYSRFGVKKPAALMVCYGASRVEKSEDGKISFFTRTMVGDNPTPEALHSIDVTANIDADYPPTFLWHCKDDPMVPYEGAVEMDAALEREGIPHQFMLFETGGHGIGVGDGTEAAGWLEKAVRFWQSVSK